MRVDRRRTNTSTRRVVEKQDQVPREGDWCYLLNEWSNECMHSSSEMSNGNSEGILSHANGKSFLPDTS